ncbi:MAG TPA: hypothetical protein VIW67_05340, partial [Terriglobales bacterium]
MLTLRLRCLFLLLALGFTVQASAQYPQQPMGFPQQGMDANGAVAPAQVPLPQALGPKAPGKIRVGIAPAQAQLGQGNNAQADYGTP